MKRIDLLKALELVKPGLASKEVIQQTTSFAFVDENVVTFNDEISVSHPVKDLDIKGVVKAEELHKFLSKTKAEDIKVTTEGNEVRIKAGKAKVGLAVHQEITLPLESIGRKGKWQDLPDDFLTAINFVGFSCSNNMSRPILTCINVDKDGLIESSDSLRITQYSISEMPVPTFLLPSHIASQLTKYEITQICRGESWIHFKTEGNTIFSCRTFEGTFPDTTEHINVEGTTIKFPKIIIDILDRASVFCDEEYDKNEQVNIKLTNKKITVSSKSKAGWFEEFGPVQYNGEDVSFAINPGFLQDIVDKLLICTLSQDRIKFEGENWIHVACLIKED